MPQARAVVLSLALAVTSIGALVVVPGGGDADVAVAVVRAPAAPPPPPRVAAPAPPPRPAPAALPDDGHASPLPADSHVPASFTAALARHLASTDYRVIRWWADDLDGDGVAENIAAICDAITGFYLVQHGDQVLEADMAVDGRNRCPDEPPPPFRLHRVHRLVELVDVRATEQRYELAIRDDRLVVVRQAETSSGPGFRSETAIDYEALTWHEGLTWDRGATSEHGVVAIAGSRVSRPTILAGATALTAARDAGGNITVHVGDRAVAWLAAAALGQPVSVDVDGNVVLVRVADVDAGYPLPPVWVTHPLRLAGHVHRQPADTARVPRRSPPCISGPPCWPTASCSR